MESDCSDVEPQVRAPSGTDWAEGRGGHLKDVEAKASRTWGGPWWSGHCSGPWNLLF